MSDLSRIENPRNYSAEVVNDLRILLNVGGSAERDARRENFYELETGGHTFYIHISPISGEVMLLAKWVSSANAASIPVAELAA